MITIQLNGIPRLMQDGATLADLVESLEPAPQHLATAVNGDFVPRHARSHQRLSDGDSVLTFQPITGG